MSHVRAVFPRYALLLQRAFCLLVVTYFAVKLQWHWIVFASFASRCCDDLMDAVYCIAIAQYQDKSGGRHFRPAWGMQ